MLLLLRLLVILPLCAVDRTQTAVFATATAASATAALRQVILIHMSNITGLHSEYNKRTMTLLVTDIGCIVMGVAAAFASGYVKVSLRWLN